MKKPDLLKCGQLPEQNVGGCTNKLSENVAGRPSKMWAAARTNGEMWAVARSREKAA